MNPASQLRPARPAAPVFGLSCLQSKRSTSSVPKRCLACRAHSPASGCQSNRRALLAGAAILLTGKNATAAGIESLQLPGAGESKYEAVRRKNKELLDKSTEAFENSDILKTLREKSDANKSRYKREMQDRYCYRQAELGVGDCGGLRLVPGATKSGKQKTPEWVKNVLKKLGRLPPEEAPASSPEPAAESQT